MTTTMSANRGGQVDEDVELLQLAGARDGEQPLHSPFALVATRATTGLPPWHWRSQGSLGHGMPRAGLCRVAVNRTLLFRADLSFAVGNGSA